MSNYYEKRRKVQALVDGGATEGERAAARAALGRLEAKGVPEDFKPAREVEYQQERRDWDDLFHDAPAYSTVHRPRQASFSQDPLPCFDKGVGGFGGIDSWGKWGRK